GKQKLPGATVLPGGRADDRRAKEVVDASGEHEQRQRRDAPIGVEDERSDDEPGRGGARPARAKDEKSGEDDRQGDEDEIEGIEEHARKRRLPYSNRGQSGTSAPLARHGKFAAAPTITGVHAFRHGGCVPLARDK